MLCKFGSDSDTLPCHIAIPRKYATFPVANELADKPIGEQRSENVHASEKLMITTPSTINVSSVVDRYAAWKKLTNAWQSVPGKSA